MARENRVAASLDETRKMLGHEEQFEGVDDVTRSDIRRKLEVYCFDCPLHYDADVARAHGFRDIIAPGAMTALWAQPANWAPGSPPLFRPGTKEISGRAQLEVPTPFRRGFNASSEVELLEPLYPGDHLHGATKLIEVNPKETRLGNGVFLTTETRLWKSTGELVSISRSTGYRYDPAPDRVTTVREKSQGERAAAYEEPADVQNPDVDWSKQVRFGDVNVGDELPAYEIWLSYQRIVMSVANDRMWGPNHHNRDFARVGGHDDIIFNTRGYEMVLEIMFRRWMGLDGWLKKLGPFRMGRSSHPGDTLTCGARVTDKEQADGKGLVHVDLWVKNPRSEAATGKAIVALPL
jgi:3-methylfumaryl-CoA hydratase